MNEETNQVVYLRTIRISFRYATYITFFIVFGFAQIGVTSENIGIFLLDCNLTIDLLGFHT